MFSFPECGRNISAENWIIGKPGKSKVRPVYVAESLQEGTLQ
jgi:hypothetical protein